MSVVTEEKKDSSLTYQVTVKGSPEIIKSLCVPDTIPEDFDQQLNALTQQGLRVIAFASK